jgi:hypothetical protein
MKKTLVLTVFLALPLVVAADDEAKGKKVDAEVHNGYFEKNNSGLKGDTSFLVFTDQDAFDKIFGVGRVMGDKQKFLPKNAFDKKIVVAAITRGNAVTSYEVEKVTTDEGTLYVQYKTTSKGGTAKYASPLIVSVDKDKFSAVEFIENGKKVGTAKIGK